ncbi:hypothetical protein MN608_10317 [Microdochium nivale]|nr:hypothetical protein MN608_10317 [Microdochium nivale]
MAPFANILMSTVAALSLTAIAIPVPVVILDSRQLAGEGNLLDSLFTSTDNGIGYGGKNAEDNLAEFLGGTSQQGSGGGGSGGGAPAPPPPPPPPHHRRRISIERRQGDKLANGAANVLNALHLTGAADLVQTDGDNVDGQLTDNATTLGAQIGADEEDVLERLGDMVPNHNPAAGATLPALPAAGH